MILISFWEKNNKIHAQNKKDEGIKILTRIITV